MEQIILPRVEQECCLRFIVSTSVEAILGNRAHTSVWIHDLFIVKCSSTAGKEENGSSHVGIGSVSACK